MDDLIAFLRARLDEDEQLAQAADQGCWTNEYDEFRCRGGAEFEHLLHHSPARVLREVGAKRLVMAMHEGSHECSDLDDNCLWVELRVCPTVKALALPYADHPDYHPDYREEWRPE
ncbi:hypothetical protein ITP53_47930 [Nonomuraea sp. K274]|uniref:Uncharacterized protein n=1 Tax=Nonomuraea cypriaca TaxID=1187855 RepID=A0A931AMS9_9ACTN|nr:DUF6221 family protein [Nonomuraea cypriaca]MBF8193274.1 hypothetical protein [Nonomuraea cypriaca]